MELYLVFLCLYSSLRGNSTPLGIQMQNVSDDYFLFFHVFAFGSVLDVSCELL